MFFKKIDKIKREVLVFKIVLKIYQKKLFKNWAIINIIKMTKS